jgi:TonB family protein
LNQRLPSGIALLLLTLAGPAQPSAKIDPACGVVQMPAPRFPPEPFLRGIHGTVTLLIEADECGVVRNVFVSGSSGDRLLDAAALKQAGQWRLPASTFIGAIRWQVQVTFLEPVHNPELSRQGQFEATRIIVSRPEPSDGSKKRD